MNEEFHVHYKQCFNIQVNTFTLSISRILHLRNRPNFTLVRYFFAGTFFQIISLKICIWAKQQWLWKLWNVLFLKRKYTPVTEAFKFEKTDVSFSSLTPKARVYITKGKKLPKSFGLEIGVSSIRRLKSPEMCEGLKRRPRSNFSPSMNFFPIDKNGITNIPHLKKIISLELI